MSTEEALRRCGVSAELTRTSAMGGGDISEAFRVETSDGPLFLKTHPDADFAVEAESLDLLRSACTLMRVPLVLGFTSASAGAPAALALELIPRGRPGPDFEERFAEGLAELHRATAPSFGLEFDTWCGSSSQPNGMLDTWSAFFAERRIAHQARLMERAGRISGRERRVFESVAARIPDWVPEPDRPALIHGDLWSGNILCDDSGRPCIIDPAAYYGTSEAELGMITLFGGLSARFYDAFAGASGLAPDWREREPLYRLYHVMNHSTLFGGGYTAQAMQLARGLPQ